MSTADEINMTAKLSGKALDAIIRAILGNDEVDSEIVQVPEGSTIDDVIKARGLIPVGDVCKSCGQQHVYQSADGEQRVIVMEAHADDEVPPKEEAKGDNRTNEERRQGALAGIRRRQAKVLRMYDILKDMEKSIDRADSKEPRNLGELIQEIASYAEFRQLAREVV